MSQMCWLLWLKLVVDSRDLGVSYKGYPLHISCWKNECEAVTHYIWLKIWSAWISCAFGSRDGYKIVYLCMNHDSHRVCSKIWYQTQTKFWQFSSNWRGRDQQPPFACLKISASVIKSHHQTDSNKTAFKNLKESFLHPDFKKRGDGFPTETKGTARNPPFSHLSKELLGQLCGLDALQKLPEEWIFRRIHPSVVMVAMCCFFGGWTIWHCQGMSRYVVDNCHGLWR